MSILVKKCMQYKIFAVKISIRQSMYLQCVILLSIYAIYLKANIAFLLGKTVIIGYFSYILTRFFI